MKRVSLYFFSLVMGFFFISEPAYAYIDPSIGSVWIQSLIALFVSLGVGIKMYWQKLKQFLFKKRSKPKSKEKSK